MVLPLSAHQLQKTGYKLCLKPLLNLDYEINHVSDNKMYLCFVILDVLQLFFLIFKKYHHKLKQLKVHTGRYRHPRLFLLLQGSPF